jgi:hypothetical protein
MSTETPDGTRRTFHTNFRIEPSGDGWKATEPDGESNVWGRGKTPLEAVEYYALSLQHGSLDDGNIERKRTELDNELDRLEKKRERIEKKLDKLPDREGESE